MTSLKGLQLFITGDTCGGACFLKFWLPDAQSKSYRFSEKNSPIGLGRPLSAIGHASSARALIGVAPENPSEREVNSADTKLFDEWQLFLTVRRLRTAMWGYEKRERQREGVAKS